ncbi:hypothetical protein IAI18_05505 [Acetobacteraceae bacterium H6797]|nr:hypothetical protein [Acetobacteraceae bacterium H6797]
MAQTPPQTLPEAPGSTSGQAPSQQLPGPGHSGDAAAGGLGGTAPHVQQPAPAQNGGSEFGAFKVENGRAPLLAPPGTLDPGKPAPSQPPANAPASPWLNRQG